MTCEILRLPRGTVSHHVGVPRRAGPVLDRRDQRDSRWVSYRLAPVAAATLQRQLADRLALTDLPAEAAERPTPPCPP